MSIESKKHISTEDPRLARLSEWVAKQLNLSNIQLEPLGGDAGFRRYFRFANPSLWLAVDAPPSTEDSRQFVFLADQLRQHGVCTPKIFATDFEQGLLLVEDFGDELLIKQSDKTKSADKNAPSDKHHATKNLIYSSSFESLIKIQGCQIQTQVPAYDSELLGRELLIFNEWFVDKLLGYKLNAVENSQISLIFESLIESAVKQPQTLAHRDFHSRNLIVIDQQTLGVLDFQGAVWGPCTYDLVSLLRDCYLRWPAEQCIEWALEYRKLAIAAGRLSETVSPDTYIQWFDAMGLQRHIKVLGIFARLNLRDGKSHYLKDLPLVLRYVLEICNKYPQYRDFYQLLTTKLLPLAQQHPWYSDVYTAGDRPYTLGDGS